MKYNININQKRLIEITPKITLKEAAILDYLVWICASENKKVTKQRIERENSFFTWVNLLSLIKNLPLLHYKSRSSVYDRIESLKKMDYIKTFSTRDERKLYISLTDKVNSLFVSPNNPVDSTEQPCSTQRTNNINIDNINIYKEVFSFWNSQKIVEHRKLTDKMKRKINSALKDYTVEEIKTSIKNYTTALKEEKYRWTYKWTLDEFITRGLTRFLETPLSNWLRNDYQEDKLTSDNY